MSTPGPPRGEWRPSWAPAFLAILLAAHASPSLLRAQTAIPAEDAVPIRVADADRDGDFLPDRLGDTLTVEGIATVGTGVLHENRMTVFLQDSTGGIQLYAEETERPIRRGDRVVATGVVGQYRGQTQLHAHAYRVLASEGDSTVPPVELRSPDASVLEAHEGELVGLPGVVVGRGENAGGDFLWVFPENGDQRVQVFAANWRGRPVDLDGFDIGDRIELTGLLGQYDPEPPAREWYQVYPRSERDLRRMTVVPGLTADRLGMVGVGMFLLTLVVFLWWVHRSNSKRRELAERLRILFDRNQAGVSLSTNEGEILDCNPAFAEMYGFESPDDLIGGRAWDLYRNLTDREEYLRALRESGEVEDYLHHHRTRDGKDVWALENATLVPTNEGVERIVGTIVDLTDRVKAERRRKSAEERYRALFEQNVAGAFRSDPNGQLLEVNTALADMLGYESPEALEGRNARSLYESPERRDELMATLQKQGSLSNEEIALESREGETVWVLENSFMTEDPETGELVNVGTVTEITEHVREEQALEALAHQDPLTGISNRRHLEETVPRILAQARRADERVAMVYLDLNDFKEINDHWGHGTGDSVLQAVAGRLEHTVREADLVGRVGGDEFLIVLAGIDSRQDALSGTRRLIRSAFREPVETAGEVFPLSAKVGVAVYPDDGSGFSDLLNQADRAMYRAARSGEAVELYDARLDQPYAERFRRRQEIHEALQRGEIIAYAQPIYRLSDRRWAGVEFLARWRRAEGDIVGAGELIPRAEAAGRLADLDRAILTQAAEYAARWRDGIVSVNVSEAFLTSDDPAEEIREVLREHPAAGDYLTIEVTERTAMLEAGGMRSVLQEIADIGLRLSLDDFGTGYSSLSLLERLRIDHVKVDRSLVQNICEGGRAEDLLKGVLELAHALNLVVVAEGVERDEQLEWLTKGGCDLAQGFLLGRPAPRDTVFAPTVDDSVQNARNGGVRHDG